MKKRLLSAALALAMVLTLLPLSALTAFATFPKSDAQGKGLTYFGKNDPDANVTDAPGYYYDNRVPGATSPVWVKADEGFLVGSTYYENITDSSKLRSTSFTFLGGSSVTVDAGDNTTLNIDMFGSGLTVKGSKLTQLTVTNTKRADKKNMGSSIPEQPVVTLDSSITSIAAETRASTVADRSFTLRLSDVDCSGSSINSWNGNATHSVELTNAKLGAVTIDGVGKKTNDQKSDTYTQTGVTITATNSTIGAINVTGNGSRVQLTDSDASSGVTIIGTGASLNVNGGSVGNVSLTGKSTATGKAGVTTTSAPPSVTIQTGSVGAITYTASDPATGDASVQLQTSSAYAASVSMEKGIVSVQSGHITGAATVKQGALNISGYGATVGSAVLGATKDTTLKVEGTGGHTIGDITGTMANVTLTIPASTTNTYGGSSTAASLANYTKHTIEGGTWKCVVPYSALKTDLDWQLNASGNYTYYTQARLGEALTAQVVKGPSTGSYTYKVTPTHNAASTNDKTLTFMNGQIPWGVITGLSVDDVVYLPSEINNVTAGRWFQVVSGQSTGTGYAAGYRWTMPDKDISLNMGGGGATGEATALSNPVVGSTSDNVDKAVRASISGNVITLTGSLPAGTTSIPVTLTTDVLQMSDNQPMKVVITVVYTSSDKKLALRNTADERYPLGITAPDLDKLRLSNGTIYTLSANIKEINASLKLQAGNTPLDITVTDTTNYKTDAQRNGLRDKLIGSTNGSSSAYFNWENAPAIVQAVNAVRGGTTNDQIRNWIKKADETLYLKTHNRIPTGGLTGTDLVYDEVWMVPYLAVTVTNHNSAGGTMSAKLVPMYRIEARDTDGSPKNPIVLEDKKPLGTLVGDMGTGAVVKFDSLSYPVGKSFGTGNTFYLHQDNTYVYVNNDTSNGLKAWTITHVGKNGLGDIVINTTDGLVKLNTATMKLDGNTAISVDTSKTITEEGTYSTLQAALDDAENGQYIEIDPNYSGSTTVNMTGNARTVYVQANGKTVVVANASGGLVDSNSKGSLYTIKLNRNVTTTSNITINSATGGSASASPNPAKYGEKVTIYLSAATGYTPNGVSVTDASGKAVSTTGSGSSYTFTMPYSNVTVTPYFTKTDEKASVSVSSNPVQGTATTTAGSTKVSAGTPVDVVVKPNAGFRTMGLYVSGTTPIRTGTNTFSFAVPSGYTNVTVTPSFDLDNGTTFADVWSSDYFSTPVSWAVGRGITNGNGSDYIFSPHNSCTRAQMVTFLYRAAGSPAVGNVTNPFWDVVPGSYYYDAVLWAVSKGITNGVEANRFGVDDTVTRAQAVTFLYRYNGSPAASSSNGFQDVSAREYFAKAVTWAANNNITNGNGSTVIFSPYDPCTRAQIVTFLYRDR